MGDDMELKRMAIEILLFLIIALEMSSCRKQWSRLIRTVKNKFVDSWLSNLVNMDGVYKWSGMADYPWHVYTVPRYAINRNILLPQDLQLRLDAMSPKEFLSYVLTKLSIDERESLMVDERQRRKTFQVNWRHHANLSGERMAQAGFYALGDNDRVQCVFCRGSLHQWEPDDHPMVEHRRSFNFCRFVKGLQCGNIEYQSTTLTEDDVKHITIFNYLTGPFDAESLGICTQRAAAVQYAPNNTRLQTFSTWPASAPIAARRMCDAGFYYTGFDDQVCCFYCDNRIRSWAAADDPWKEHARWFPDCVYLIQKKGQDYIDEVRANSPPGKKRFLAIEPNPVVVRKHAAFKKNLMDMRRICEDLGHSPEHITQAIERNGQRFADVRDLIDAVYAVEEMAILPTTTTINAGIAADNSFVDEAPSHLPTGRRDSDEVRAICEKNSALYYDERGEAQNCYQPFFQMELFPAIGKQPRKHAAGNCLICERRAGNIGFAAHIALPCGHLVFCEACLIDERYKYEGASESQAACPADDCFSMLTATIKVSLGQS